MQKIPVHHSGRLWDFCFVEKGVETKLLRGVFLGPFSDKISHSPFLVAVGSFCVQKVVKYSGLLEMLDILLEIASLRNT